MEEGNFDYKQAIEEEEKLDFNNLKDCPNCKKPIASDATMCYFCGQEVVSADKSPWLAWVIVATIIIFVASILLK